MVAVWWWRWKGTGGKYAPKKGMQWGFPALFYVLKWLVLQMRCTQAVVTLTTNILWYIQKLCSDLLSPQESVNNNERLSTARTSRCMCVEGIRTEDVGGGEVLCIFLNAKLLQNVHTFLNKRTFSSTLYCATMLDLRNNFRFTEKGQTQQVPVYPSPSLPSRHHLR